jgi:hypothetical protein
MNIASDTGETVVTPLKVSPELNIDRKTNELALRITIGRNIEWDYYKVMLNGFEIKTEPGTTSIEGETIYFDYQGDPLTPGIFYDLDIIDLKAQMVVYSDTIIANSYTPEGTGVYGYVTSSSDGKSIMYADVFLYQNGVLFNSTTTNPTGAYQMGVVEGTYDIVCIINESFQDPTEGLFNNYTGTITINELNMLHHDILLRPLVSDTAVLKGYIYDNSTNASMANIEVEVTDDDTFEKVSTTGTNGYFEFNIPASIFSININVEGYVRYSQQYIINESETRTVNINLIPIPPQTCVVYGYVYEQKSGDPLNNCEVFTVSAYLTNYTLTDVNGSFAINVVPGDVKVLVNIVGYYYWEKVITLTDEEHYLLYIYLEKEPGG